jgi:hypothetical protein
MTIATSLLRSAAIAGVAIGLAGTLNHVVDAYAAKQVQVSVIIPVGVCANSSPGGNTVTYTEEGGVCWASFSNNPQDSIPEKGPNGDNLNATACAAQAQHECSPSPPYVWLAP